MVEKGWTAVFSAAHNGHNETIKLLVEQCGMRYTYGVTVVPWSQPGNAPSRAHHPFPRPNLFVCPTPPLQRDGPRRPGPHAAALRRGPRAGHNDRDAGQFLRRGPERGEHVRPDARARGGARGPLGDHPGPHRAQGQRGRGGEERRHRPALRGPAEQGVHFARACVRVPCGCVFFIATLLWRVVGCVVYHWPASHVVFGPPPPSVCPRSTRCACW